MTDRTWTPEELQLIRDTDEVRVSSRRADGTITHGNTIWAVAVGSSAFVRSTDGPQKLWFRNARARGNGYLHLAGEQISVRFADAAAADQDEIEAAYRTKYRQRPAYNVNRAAGSRATLELVPVEP